MKLTFHKKTRDKGGGGGKRERRASNGKRAGLRGRTSLQNGGLGVALKLNLGSVCQTRMRGGDAAGRRVSAREGEAKPIGLTLNGKKKNELSVNQAPVIAKQSRGGAGKSLER